MNAAARIGILGGTFDPIHLGHIETALAARDALALDRIIVLASRVPPHRTQHPMASSYHRFAMTALAVNGIDRLEASDLELCAPGPSYTADTLERFRDATQLQRSQIFFITGSDAFAEIATWHRYPEVLDLAQFVVVSRPGFPIGALRGRLPALAPRMCAAGDDASRCGDLVIYLLDARTPDVSSTEIRRRINAHLPLTGLVPAPVATHIQQHELYQRQFTLRTADHLHGQD